MNIFEFIQCILVLFDDTREAQDYITQNNQDTDYEYSLYNNIEESIKKDDTPMNIFEFIHYTSALFDYDNDSRESLYHITQNNQDVEY